MTSLRIPGEAHEVEASGSTLQNAECETPRNPKQHQNSPKMGAQRLLWPATGRTRKRGMLCEVRGAGGRARQPSRTRDAAATSFKPTAPQPACPPLVPALLVRLLMRKAARAMTPLWRIRWLTMACGRCARGYIG